MGTDGSGFDMREHITRTGAETTVVIELHGEIDILASLTLTPRTDPLVAEQPRDVVVDLRAVTFLDGGGLRLLDRIQDGAVARGGRLRIVRGTARVMRVFRLACAERDFTFLDGPPTTSGQDDGRPPHAVGVV
jgi:anti-sigma B factor antagonist